MLNSKSYQLHKTWSELKIAKIVIVVLVFLFFLVSRFLHLNTLSLDSDEIFSISYSKVYDYNPVNFQNPLDDGNPPLHFIYIKAWSNLLSFNDYILRILPSIFSVFSFIYFYKISKKTLRFSFLQITLALLLFSGSSLIFHFSLNIRPYIFLVLSALGTYYHFNNLLFKEGKGKRRDIILINVWTVLGLYNHYSFAIFFIFLVVTICIFNRKNCLRNSFYFVPTLVLFSPWVVRFALSQVYPKEWGAGAPYFFWQASGEPLTLFRWTNVLSNNIFQGYIGSVLKIFLVLFVSLFSIIQFFDKKIQLASRFLFLFFFVATLLFFIVPVYTVLTIPRYAIFLAPFFYLVFVQIIKNRYLQLSVLILSIIFFLPKYLLPHNNEDWRGATKYIEQNLTNGENLVLADVYYIVPVIQFYFEKNVSFGCFKMSDESGECRYTLEYLNNFDSIFYVSSGWNADYDGFIENDFIKQTDHRTFPAVDVYVFTNQK